MHGAWSGRFRSRTGSLDSATALNYRYGMEIDEIDAAVHAALRGLTHPRYFASERAFQGQLLVELAKHLRLPDQAIIEQEYQKILKVHGLKIRPDIVIHEPFDPARHRSRSDGNVAVLELKLRASADQAASDFDSLLAMQEALEYPVCIFINVGGRDTFVEQLPVRRRAQFLLYAVELVDGAVQVLAHRP
jgi:hypothetical protein